jgi:hypothetical protein
VPQAQSVVVDAAEVFNRRRRQRIAELISSQLAKRERVVDFTTRHVKHDLLDSSGRTVTRVGMLLEMYKLGNTTTDNNRLAAWVDTYFIDDKHKGPFSEEVLAAIGELQPFPGHQIEESFASETYVG